MEFDNNTPVSDEQRRLAESKKVTLQPVHADIRPEDLADSEIAARHINEPAIGNIEGDIEQDKAQVRPSDGLLHRPETAKRTGGSVAAITAAAVLAVLLAGTFFFFK